MFQSDRFALAIHTIGLAYIAGREATGDLVSSSELAEMAGAHPVHVRRVLGGLREAGLLVSQPGRNGGWRLARDPQSITLLDIYRASDPRESVWMPTGEVGVACPDIPEVLQRCLHSAETALERELSTLTLADVIAGTVATRPTEPAAAD